jgi:hypothetical protein
MVLYGFIAAAERIIRTAAHALTARSEVLIVPGATTSTSSIRRPIVVRVDCIAQERILCKS